MKKIYLSILTCVSALVAHGQLSLTQSFNEPVLGDVNTTHFYDSVGVVPKNTGAGQMWNFSGVTTTTVTESISFTSVGSSGPNSGIYTGAMLSDFDGGSFHTYYKSTTNQLENLGFEDVYIILQFTNTAIVANYPITMGSSNSDLASGTCTTTAALGALGNLPGVVDGGTSMQASGTGTLMVPGGGMLTNILQIITNQTININVSNGTLILNNSGVEYNYYHSSMKFPVLTVKYVTVTGSFPSYEANIKFNAGVVTGINDKNFDATFSIFPNPARDHFNITLSNSNNESVKIEVINSLGAIAQIIDLGNESTISKNIAISNLSQGIYMVKTTLGNKVSVRKLIIE